MSSKNIDSLDIVEMVMVIEEVFDVEVPGEIDQLGSPREIVDCLEVVLSNRRPNKAAVALLRKIARERQQLALAEGLEGTWRREQIAASSAEYFGI
jgi:Phosphopantetheine attachment site